MTSEQEAIKGGVLIGKQKDEVQEKLDEMLNTGKVKIGKFTDLNQQDQITLMTRDIAGFLQAAQDQHHMTDGVLICAMSRLLGTLIATATGDQRAEVQEAVLGNIENSIIAFDAAQELKEAEEEAGEATKQ